MICNKLLKMPGLRTYFVRELALIPIHHSEVMDLNEAEKMEVVVRLKDLKLKRLKKWITKGVDVR